MGSHLQETLRRLCSNTSWDYAIFWKVRHGANMMLTWEDAYRINRDVIGIYSQDSIELALAKMSYYVYSFGEGVVGQVAVTGKHLWISADIHVTDSSSSSQYCDGWRTQFSAGIKTVAVVAVIPHGVLQLGSCHNIAEDMKLVNHIRYAFLEFQDSFTSHIPIITPANMENSCLSEVSTSVKQVQMRKRDEWSHGSNTRKIKLHNITVPTTDPTVDLLTSEIPKNAGNNPTDALNEFFEFAAGCELYEALGPAFQKQNTNSNCETEENIETVIDIPLEVGVLKVNQNSGNLLEAVVANVCSSTTVSDDKSSKILCKPDVSLGPIWSSKGFSSTSNSRCSDEFLGPKETSKNNKKRAKPGENCRPRPRDRQLIQDRIKELRELVPNGSKCSIDSLLERTVKHMVFMQCITKHADKLDKCGDSKLFGKETSVRGSSTYEQGSSWAMEVGPQMNVCPIKVETINVNGQMLVEMLSEHGDVFLEVADVIRSLGLSILKGVTETIQTDKTLISFVVEGENNRSVPRMDILWSLVQMLQSKINT